VPVLEDDVFELKSEREVDLWQARKSTSLNAAAIG
jgi:hypothetical protein